MGATARCIRVDVRSDEQTARVADDQGALVPVPYSSDDHLIPTGGQRSQIIAPPDASDTD